MTAVWQEAIAELWRHRLRTLLTLLGLIFGVGAIVAMLGVGEGSRREALRLVESLGLHNLIVERAQLDADTLKETRARSLGLTLADARAARDVVPGAGRFAAEKRVRAYAVFSDFAGSDAQASGVSRISSRSPRCAWTIRSRRSPLSVIRLHTICFRRVARWAA